MGRDGLGEHERMMAVSRDKPSLSVLYIGKWEAEGQDQGSREQTKGGSNRWEAL